MGRWAALGQLLLLGSIVLKWLKDAPFCPSFEKAFYSNITAMGIYNSEIPLDIICTLPLCINLKRLPKLNNISIVESWQRNFATVHSYSDERGERNLRWPHSWSESTGVVKPALNYSPFSPFSRALYVLQFVVLRMVFLEEPRSTQNSLGDSKKFLANVNRFNEALLSALPQEERHDVAIWLTR